MTEFYNKALVLAELYERFKDEDIFKDYMNQYDIGVPLAWMINQGICMPSDEGMMYVSDAFEYLLIWWDVKDTGFANLDEVIEARLEKSK